MISSFKAILVTVLEGQKRSQISESPDGAVAGQVQCNLGYFSKLNGVQRLQCQPSSHLVCCSPIACHFPNKWEIPNTVLRDRKGCYDQFTTFVGNCETGIYYSRLEYIFYKNILSVSYCLLFPSLKNCYDILCLIMIQLVAIYLTSQCTDEYKVCFNLYL